MDRGSVLNDHTGLLVEPTFTAFAVRATQQVRIIAALLSLSVYPAVDGFRAQHGKATLQAFKVDLLWRPATAEQPDDAAADGGVVRF